MALIDPQFAARTQVVSDFLEKNYLDTMSRMWILDLGCGDGSFLRNYVEWGCAPVMLHGVDENFEQIQLARKLSPAAMSLHRSELNNLLFNGNPFHIVTAWNFLFLDKPQEFYSKVASEIQRVLWKSGNLFIASPNRISKSEIKSLFSKLRMVNETAELGASESRIIQLAAA